jgi:hypothetical protein
MLRRIVQFLIENPIVAFFVLAWIAGMIGNVVRGAKKAAPRPQGARRPPAPVAIEPARSPEAVAAEMRRILGLDPEPVAKPEPRPHASPRPVVAPEVVRRPLRTEITEGDRAPAPVMPSTQRRRLELHDNPHVGEAIEQRHMVESARSAARDGAAKLGGLGGRAVAGPRHVRPDRRLVDLHDLKRIFVLSEILGPPLAMRDGGRSARA